MMRGQGWVLLCGLAATPALAEEGWLRPTLVGEVDYRQHGSDVEGFDGFTLARLRLGAEARPVPWLVARGVAEWALEKPVLIDAFVAFTGLKDWRISLGYNKTPLFPSAHDEHLEARAIPELSGLDQAFWPRRDLGLEVRWSPSTLPLETWVRVGNGSRSPLGNDNQLPALDARLDGRWGRSAGAPLSFWGARVGAGVHVESAFDRAGIGGTGPQGFVYYRPPPVSGARTVTEAHARLDAGRLRVAAEAAAAWEHRDRDTDGNPSTPREVLPTMQSQGASLEVSYVAWGQPRGDGPFWPQASASDDDALETLRAGKVPDGALELAARVERLWLGRGAPDVQSGGSLNGALAVRWWTTSFLGLGVAGYVLRYDTAPLEEPDRRTSWLVLARTTVSFH
ncbi:hypothetical protein LZ198_10275 [Myxococcus sp. K15C18031901]|uniref:hypothetical protein n=1 Tax=Myxococcus dinghuensis TaxID=2906761 RepID=UPI0020A83137|nr:hypothetical protein [Myxococcus dinghuensis]MCP3099256.1 hypothetical protein [Myxococcus dinghuensis]